MVTIVAAAGPAFSVSVATQVAQGRGRCTCVCASPLHRASWFGARVRGSDSAGVQYPARIQRNVRHDGVVRAVFGGGGILGVGPQEILVIAAVGWFLLGPKQLLALSKDIGKIVGEVRRAADEARITFTEAIESDIEAMENEGETETVAGPTLPTDEIPLSKDELLVGAAEVSADDEAVRNNFLEQLQRANDPAQVAPDEIPDLDLDAELEVARLEQQLLAAKQKLARKRTTQASESAAPAGGSAGQSGGDELQKEVS